MSNHCLKCGGEGRVFKSKYGGNDPDVWDAGKCEVCDGSGMRKTVTIFVPDGYEDAEDFLKDCQFERADIPTSDLLEMLIKRLQWDGSQAELNSITIGEMRRSI